MKCDRKIEKGKPGFAFEQQSYVSINIYIFTGFLWDQENKRMAFFFLCDKGRNETLEAVLKLALKGKQILKASTTQGRNVSDESEACGRLMV